jgi:SAM-dependent methyltransferase
MNEHSGDELRQAVQENYKKVAESGLAGCGCSLSSCCDGTEDNAAGRSLAVGYSLADLASVPEGANLGLGCGNPQAIASLQAGEVVLDLGSGGGFDCFLAAQVVGMTGKVIGVDMTPEMVKKARENTRKTELKNVEFRLGEIEHLPVADGSIDVILSNCVINLSPEKDQVFAEAYRVLKPGGRLAISDVVATAELPAAVRQDLRMYSGCISGASPVQELETILARLGFVNIRIIPKDESKAYISEWVPGSKVEDFVASATIEAVKPLTSR